MNHTLIDLEDRAVEQRAPFSHLVTVWLVRAVMAALGLAIGAFVGLIVGLVTGLIPFNC